MTTLPHAAPMVLIDRLLEFAPDHVCCEAVVRDDGLFDSEGRVPAYVAIEYMAQAIGAWAGPRALQAGEPVRAGFLLGTRRMELDVDAFPAGTRLLVHGRRLAESDGGLASFDCEVALDGRTVARARLNVFRPADPQAVLAADHMP